MKAETTKNKGYKLALKITLPCACLAAGAGALIGALIDRAGPLLSVSRCVGAAVLGIMGAFGYITAVFAFFNRKYPVSPPRSNPVPGDNRRLSSRGPAAGIIFPVIYSAALLAEPRVFGGFFEGSFIHFFSFPIMRDARYIILLFIMLGSFKEFFKLYEGRYSKRLAVITSVCDLLPISSIFLIDATIINPDFVRSMEKWVGGSWPSDHLSLFVFIFILITAAALLLDAAATLLQTFKKDSRQLKKA